MAQWQKNLPAMQEPQEMWVWSLSWEDPLEEDMATTPVFLSGEFNGERSLEGYSPWGYKALDMTEQLTFTFLKLMYRFSVISIKIPAAFLNNGQADYKSHM